MRIRESGMPDEIRWNSFFDVLQIFDKLQINDEIENLAEIGCGYGTFTLMASTIVRGDVYAFDIDEVMIKSVQAKLEMNKISNVHLAVCDVIENTTGLPNESVDYVMLFNLLHLESPLELLAEVKRILKFGGKVGVIHWRSDIETPRGPSLNIRPTPETILFYLDQAGFKIHGEPMTLKPFHYGVLGCK